MPRSIRLPVGPPLSAAAKRRIRKAFRLYQRDPHYQRVGQQLGIGQERTRQILRMGGFLGIIPFRPPRATATQLRHWTRRSSQ